MAEQLARDLLAQLQAERQQTAQLVQQMTTAQQQNAALLTQLQQTQAAATAAAQAATQAAAAPPQITLPARTQDDTKYLNNVKEFDGKREHWQAYSFKFQSFLLALDPAYGPWLTTLAATANEAHVLNAVLRADDAALSLRIYNMLTMSNSDDSKSFNIVERAGRGEWHGGGYFKSMTLTRRVGRQA